MRTDLFDYELPPERIAQSPLPRGDSRLLVLHRGTGQIEHRRFADLIDYLLPGDTLVLNDTRVTARRLEAERESGLPAEVMLLRPVGERCWDALVKPARPLRPGRYLTLIGPKQERVAAQIVGETPDGGRTLEFPDRTIRDALATWGETPLPPYIRTPLPHDQEERYQTVYSTHAGSAAAPTAGLHFTPELLSQIVQKGVAIAQLTLQVGVGTFRPVRTEQIDDHTMHAEYITLEEAAVHCINATPGRVFAIGTTTVRALESAAARSPHPEEDDPQPSRVVSFSGETDIFITPGYTFRAVDALVTNFHQPRSTLLMLVSAFAGREAVMNAYREAIRHEYRFFSFGDAMLIV